jgi:RNA polymerase sigma-70 factor (ECF subfamily)
MPPDPPEPDRRQPPTTRWSLIVAATGEHADEAAAQRALNELCRMYWRPVLQFIIRKGYSLPDAQDLAQDFFLRLATPGFLRRADPEKGRFRALVFASLKHVLVDAGERLRAMKRGAGQQVASLEEWMEGEVVNISPGSATAQYADQLFDYDWAALVVRNALRRLEQEFAARGKKREFEVIRHFLADVERGNAYADAVTSLNLPIGTVKAMIHRLRVQYGVLLRDEVAQTLADLRDLDDEVRHLCAILASPRNLSDSPPPPQS